jgi:hypothetical protein
VAAVQSSYLVILSISRYTYNLVTYTGGALYAAGLYALWIIDAGTGRKAQLHLEVSLCRI